MSEDFYLLDVTVHRVQVDNVVIKVPKGWKPALWELRELQEQGAKAWADVPDADAWLRELRGGGQ